MGSPRGNAGRRKRALTIPAGADVSFFRLRCYFFSPPEAIMALIASVSVWNMANHLPARDT